LWTTFLGKRLKTHRNHLSKVQIFIKIQQFLSKHKEDKIGEIEVILEESKRELEEGRVHSRRRRDGE
jgi:hypothetical protein